MSFKAPLKTVRNVVAEAGKLVVFSSRRPFVKLAHTTNANAVCNHLPGPSTARRISTTAPACVSAQSRKIPAARRENGEDMNPREWAEQLRNVREWKSRQESIRESPRSLFRRLPIINELNDVVSRHIDRHR
jgi:hypothetical protein